MSHPNAVRMEEICVQQDALALELSTLAERFNAERGYEFDGCVSTVDWLKRRCRRTVGQALEIMSVARSLPRLPEVASAVKLGEIGFQHAAVIAEAVERVGSESLLDRQSELFEKAEAVDPSALRKEVRRVEFEVEAERMRREAEWAYRSRRLQVKTMADGRVVVDGILDAEGGAGLKTALNAAMGLRAKDETRTEPQRRADGLVDVARLALDGRKFGETGCQRPQLNVTVDLASREGAIEGLGPVARETIERLLCDCALSVNGSNEARTFSPPMRRGLMGKHQHCQWPGGCERPVAWAASPQAGTPSRPSPPKLAAEWEDEARERDAALRIPSPARA